MTAKQRLTKIFILQSLWSEWILPLPARKQRFEWWAKNLRNFRSNWADEGWVSPKLGVRFELGAAGLEIYRPKGQKFISYAELEEQGELDRQRAELLAAKQGELNIDPDLPSSGQNR